MRHHFPVECDVRPATEMGAEVAVSVAGNGVDATLAVLSQLTPLIIVKMYQP